MQKILVIDDEVHIREGLAQFLEKEGFAVTCVENITQAKSKAVNAFDGVILDWSLPDGMGIDLLRGWRAEDILVPVIMLTAKSQLIDKVVGLELGADDYMTKPFEPRELVARLRARLRGSAARSQDPSLAKTTTTVSANGIELHLQSHEVMYEGKTVELTKMEWGLLRLLMENQNRVYTRDELLKAVWGLENYPTTRTVDNHILQLRQKFSENFFETVRGVGYRFRTMGSA